MGWLQQWDSVLKGVFTTILDRAKCLPSLLGEKIIIDLRFKFPRLFGAIYTQA